MFSSQFFWKFYISSAALVLLTGASVATLAMRNMEAALLEEKEANLRHQCVAMSTEATRFMRGELGDDPQELIDRVRGHSDLRITLIDVDGTVLVDTHESPNLMDNHASRPEVQDALINGFGASTRRSDTVRERMFYVAFDLRRGTVPPMGVLRLSVSLASIDAELAAIRLGLVAVSGIGMVAALCLGLFLAHRLTRPLSTIASAAESLSSGQYETRLTDLPGGEFRVLGEALNNLGGEVSRRLRKASGEEARLRAMLAGMVEGVIAVGEDGSVEFCNLAAQALLGVDSLRGQNLSEAAPIDGLEALLKGARSQPNVVRGELVFQSPNGREVVLGTHAHRFEADGRLGVVVVLQDRTELRKLEQVRREFVSNVSHELKTPLTSIGGYVEVLLDGALDDEQNNRRFLHKVTANVERLKHLVTDLLSLGRIEERSNAPSIEPVDLRPLIVQALRMRKNAVTERGLTCNFEETESMTVLGESESLIQVIDNLLDNAIRYTPEGGNVAIRAIEEGESILIEVEDTGIGIPTEDLDRVFERFYRVDKARSQAAGGTGLGLSIVKHLVAAMEGEIEVRSEAGVGTVFSLRLPREDFEPHELPRVQPTWTPEREPNASPRDGIDPRDSWGRAITG